MCRILVPVDFSRHTDTTIRYAVEFARHYPGEIRLFHTYFDRLVGTEATFTEAMDLNGIYNEELVRAVISHAEQETGRLKRHVEQLLVSEKIENTIVDYTLVGGEIEHELRLLCADFHPDYVFMGTRGKGNTLNIWGKVSTFIVDHAKIPVFTLPELHGYKGFSDIMFATDLSGRCDKLVSRLAEVFHPFGPTIHVVHFYHAAKQQGEPGKMQNLEKRCREEVKGVRLRFHLADTGEDQQKGIDDFVAKENIRLIAFHPQKRGLLYMLFTKNITRKNLFATNLPLLSLPAKDQDQ